jgi:excisionase family DNA binding protein
VPRTVGIRTEPCSELGDPTITTAPTPERYHLELVNAARLGAAGVGSEYLDEDELAARLRVSPKTIYRLRIRHQIPWIKLGRIVRYIQKEVEEAIQQNLTVRAIRTKKAASKPTSISKATVAKQ